MTLKICSIALASQFPVITSLMYVINPKANDTLNGLEVIHFSGDDHLMEYMENLQFRISPKSFFQTNTTQAYRLYCVTREFAELTGNEIVYDLYTGTGTIALFLAARCRKVVGIEYVDEAIQDARRNARTERYHQCVFFYRRYPGHAE